MKIDFLIKNLDKTHIFMYLERYVNEGSRTYSSFSRQPHGDPRYQPLSETSSFAISCLEVPKENTEIYLDNPSKKIFEYYIKNKTVLMPLQEYPDLCVVFPKILFKQVF